MVLKNVIRTWIFLKKIFLGWNFIGKLLDVWFFFSDFQVEPWFGSHFTEKDITKDLIELWKNPPEIDAALHLPSKNEFIPSDFSIRADDKCNDDVVNSAYPRCIVDEPLMKFWYKLDSTFKVPRANTYVRINLKGGNETVKSCVLSELFILLLKDELNEIIYQVNHLSCVTLNCLFVCVFCPSWKDWWADNWFSQ